MSADGQRTKQHKKIAKDFIRLSRVSERYRQTDGGTTTYSERERSRSLKTTKNITRASLEHCYNTG